MSEMELFVPQNPMLRKYGSSLKGRILILEGLISAGKSTAGEKLLAECHKMGLKAIFFPEPLCPTLLKLFLGNQKKYAFAFQMTMMCERKAIYEKAVQKAAEGYFCIIDRSMHGDYCFAKMHHSAGNISDAEWKSYLQIMKKDKPLHPDYLIYLKVSPSTAFSRCAKRDRDGESAYTLEYFTNLCQVYDPVIELSDSVSTLVIDWNEERDIESVGKALLDRIHEIYSGF